MRQAVGWRSEAPRRGERSEVRIKTLLISHECHQTQIADKPALKVRLQVSPGRSDVGAYSFAEAVGEGGSDDGTKAWVGKRTC